MCFRDSMSQRPKMSGSPRTFGTYVIAPKHLTGDRPVRFLGVPAEIEETPTGVNMSLNREKNSSLTRAVCGRLNAQSGASDHAAVGSTSGPHRIMPSRRRCGRFGPESHVGVSRCVSLLPAIALSTWTTATTESTAATGPLLHRFGLIDC